MGFTSYNFAELQLLAATPPTGFALQNGTPTILSWTAPNDGQLHRVIFMGSRNITVNESGGQITLTVTPNPGGSTIPSVVAAGSGTAGNANLGSTGLGQVIAPGSTVTLAQTTALTLGACTVYAELWGA